MTNRATFSHQYVTSQILAAKLTIINKIARCFALRGILRRACHCCNKVANGERYINQSCQRGDERAKQKHASNKNGVVGSKGSTTPNAPNTSQQSNTPSAQALLCGQYTHSALTSHRQPFMTAPSSMPTKRAA